MNNSAKNFFNSKRPGVALNIAHRGARSLAPENTLLAAGKALAVGADLWELDVQWSRDRELVVVHDDRLERTTDVRLQFPDRAPWSVAAFSSHEIAQLDAGSWFCQRDPFGQIDAGCVTPAEQAACRGLGVPTLSEALVWTQERRWAVNVELKPLAGDDDQASALVAQVVECVERTNTAERVLISSFDLRVLRACKRVAPHLSRAVLVEKAPPEPLALLTELGARVYHPHISAYDQALARALRNEGITVNVWGAEREEQEKALSKDVWVNGIFTDYPQRLDRLLRVDKA